MAKTIELTCRRCNKPFPLKASVYDGRLKRGQTIFYCSRTCKNGLTMFLCDWCKQPILVRQSQLTKSKSGRHYCSIEHANKHQGLLKGTKCEDCGTPIWSNNRKCMSCYRLSRPSILNMRKCDVNPSRIREHARLIAIKHGLVTRCANPTCEYEHHIQACHKQAVANFNPETLISEINRPSNLIGLCARCHWESDHGILSLVGLGIPSPTNDD